MENGSMTTKGWNPKPGTIPALSLWQPWASLVALGHKHFETRSWATSYRGPIAIHAAQRRPSFEGLSIGVQRHIAGLFESEGITALETLPLGSVLCIANLIEVYPTIANPKISKELPPTVKKRIVLEWNLGDFSPMRYAWHLEVTQVFETPIAARGRQSLWEFPF